MEKDRKFFFLNLSNFMILNLFELKYWINYWINLCKNFDNKNNLK